MLFKSSLKKLLIYLSLFILSYEQQCISGKNCPIKQGKCNADICECNKGYETLVVESTPTDQHIYCNYKQISQYTPLIMELFLPSIGHFKVGKYYLGLFKLILIITYCILSYYLYHELKVPDLFVYLFVKLGLISIIIPGLRGQDPTIQLLRIIMNFLGIVGTLMHANDILCYFFGVYTDGNGIPFA